MQLGPRGDESIEFTHCISGDPRLRLEFSMGPIATSNVDGFGQEMRAGPAISVSTQTLIHPGQIEACNAIFTPPAEEIARAARSSPRSNGRRTPRAARSSLTGKWWSGARRYGQAHDRDR